MSSQKTLYSILGVVPTATAEDIETAYLKLQEVSQSSDDSSLLRVAYDTLRVPELRAAYDRKLARQEAVLNASNEISEAPKSGRFMLILILLLLVGGGVYWLKRPIPATPPVNGAVARGAVADQSPSLDGDANQNAQPASTNFGTPPPAVTGRTSVQQTAAEVSIPKRGPRRAAFDPTYLAWSVFTIRQRNLSGSGVLIGPDRILTNCHVLAGGASNGLVVIHSLTKQVTKVEKYARLDGEDACLLYAPGAGGELIEWGSSASLKAGDVVHSFGHPGGSAEVIWSEGQFLDRTMRGGEEFLMSANYCRPGSSGGPLLDEQGRLVGIITAGQRFLSMGGEAPKYGACLSVTEATARTLLSKTMFPIGLAPAQYQQNY